MSCGHCVAHVTAALEEISGVDKAEVSLPRGQAEVSYDPAKTNIDEMADAVAEAGYEVVR